VIMEGTGKKIADVDYWMNDSDPPAIPINFLLALPAAPERLLLKMDDGRTLKFQVLKTAGKPTMIAEGRGPAWRGPGFRP